MLKSSHIAFIITMSLLCLLGTVLNFAILLVYRNKWNQNASVFLLYSLALIDLVISILVVPLTVFSSIDEFFIDDSFYCGVTFFMRYFSCSISCVLLALIAFERYKIISAKTMTRFRFLQKSLIYNTKRAIVVAVVFCFSIAVWCFIFIESNTIQKSCEPREEYVKYFFYYNILCCLVLCIIMLLMIVLYIKSYLVVKQTTNRIFFKNLDSYEKKARILNFLVRFKSKSTDEMSVDKSGSENSNENNQENSHVLEYKDDESKSKQEFTNISSNKSNECILGDFYPKEVKKNREKPFRIDSKLSTISESLDRKSEKIKFNDILNDNLSIVSAVQEQKEDKNKGSNYIFKESTINGLAPVFIFNNGINIIQSQPTNTTDLSKSVEKPNFRKRLSNLTVSNSFVRKDWQVAKMFCLVTIIFIVSWIPWILITVQLVKVIESNRLLINLYLFNNVINPIIYSFLSKSFRNDFYALAKSLKRKKFC